MGDAILRSESLLAVVVVYFGRSEARSGRRAWLPTRVPEGIGVPINRGTGGGGGGNVESNEGGAGKG